MCHAVKLLAFVLVALALNLGAALAEHLNGTYVGTGDAAGTTITLTQTGNVLSGALSGLDNGTLSGEADPAGGISGSIDLVGVGQLQFTGRETAQGLRMEVTGSNGTFPFDFVRETAASAPAEAGTITEEAGATAAPAARSESYYYAIAGEQFGPVALDALLALVAQGTITRDTLVWKPGQEAWLRADRYEELAASLPPPPPAEIRYYVLEGEVQVGPLSLAEALARMESGETTGADLAWKDGLEAWARAETFAEFEQALSRPPEAPPVLPQSPANDAPAGDGPPPAPGTADAPVEGGAPPAIDAIPLETPGADVPEQTSAADPDADELDGLVRRLMDEGFPAVAVEARDATVSCLVQTFLPLSAEERAMLVAAGLEPSSAQQDALETAHPGIAAAVPACLRPIEEAVAASGGDAGASTSVSLPDGRSLEIVGGNGGEQSVIAVEGGYEIGMGGKALVFKDGGLTIDGTRVEVPPFSAVLRIDLAGGEAVLTPDPAP